MQPASAPLSRPTVACNRENPDQGSVPWSQPQAFRIPPFVHYSQHTQQIKTEPNKIGQVLQTANKSKWQPIYLTNMLYPTTYKTPLVTTQIINQMKIFYGSK